MNTTFRSNATCVRPYPASAMLVTLLTLAPYATALQDTSPSTAGAATGSAVSADNRPRNKEGWTAILKGEAVAAPEIPMGEESVTRAILDEGLNRNRVMDHLRHLTQVIGPRLTGSTAAETANNWCKQQYESWGLSNARLEQWGTIGARFDRGPSSGKVLLRRERKNDDGTTTTDYDTLRDMQLTTLAWAAGTNGPVRAPVIREPQNEDEYAAVKDKLAGSWILIKAPPAVGQRGIRGGMGARYDARRDGRKKLADGKTAAELSIAERLVADGVAGYISTSRDERVWTGGIPGWRTLDAADVPPDVSFQVRLSDYDYINSRLADGDPIEVEVDLMHTITPGPIPVYNTIAEIPGTLYPDEVVIVSAHLDSWDGPGSQGATDNGTGSAVTLEAARILAAVGAKPHRTIKFINWTGEEQGLLGSKGYADASKDVLDKISAVFVDDGGTNYQGGLPCADNMADFLAAATAPTNFQFYCDTDKKHLNVNIRPSGRRNPRGGGSDHATFNAVGVPGFFWDEVGRAEYGYGWHTQHDKIDLAIPVYLKQSATNSAITAYRLACAPSLLPRERPPTEEEKAAEERTPPRRRPRGGDAPAAGEGGSAPQGQ